MEEGRKAESEEMRVKIVAARGRKRYMQVTTKKEEKKYLHPKK